MVYSYPTGCHSYSVPGYLRQHIDLIKPTVHFNHRPAANALQKRNGDLTARNGPKQANVAVTITPSLENCDKIITLDCLRALYNINYTPISTDKNSFGIGSLCCRYLVLQTFTMLLYSWIHTSSILRTRSWFILQVYLSVCVSILYVLTYLFQEFFT